MRLKRFRREHAGLVSLRLPGGTGLVGALSFCFYLCQREVCMEPGARIWVLLVTICSNLQKQLSTLGSEVDKLQKQQALQAQVHKLQMLLRMAEITKLEEHIKCTRRSDSVKEEKMGKPPQDVI